MRIVLVQQGFCRYSADDFPVGSDEEVLRPDSLAIVEQRLDRIVRGVAEC